MQDNSSTIVEDDETRMLVDTETDTNTNITNTNKGSCSGDDVEPIGFGCGISRSQESSESLSRQPTITESLARVHSFKSMY